MSSAEGPAAEQEGPPLGSDEAASPVSRHFRVESTEHQDIPETVAAVTEVPSPRDGDGEGDGDANVAAETGSPERGTGESGETSQELQAKLARQRSRLAQRAKVFESKPEASTADAAFHLGGVSWDAPELKEWLASLQEPEEDRRPEFFSEGLQNRGALPSHAPRAKLSDEDRAKLAALVKDMAELKQKCSADMAGMGNEQELLRQKEAELKVREQALDRERLKILGQQDYPRPSWLAKLEGTINVGVVGNSGVGKSLLINRLRGLQPGEHGWAPVGVRETTKMVSMYAFPCDRRARLWDFPGAGTPLFPLRTYIARMGLRYLDHVIIVTAGRFTETEMKLMQELRQHNVPFLLVRTKIDIDVWNNKEDNNIEAQQTIDMIRTDIKQNSKDMCEEQPFLVSLRDCSAYDFQKLLHTVFPYLNSGRTGTSWDDPWAMPAVLSATASAIQGRWHDGQGQTYCVQGLQVHISSSAGAGTVLLTESEGKVWWCGRWSIDESSAGKARASLELRWAPFDLQVAPQPIIWRWLE